MTSIDVETRSNRGKGSARKLRAAGQVPGIIYGGGRDPIPVALDPVALVDIFQATGNRNTVVSLQVDGDQVPCLVREVQRHPVNRNLLHVDFFRVDGEAKVQVDVRVVPVGKCAAHDLGGRVRAVRRTLEALCLPNDIPEYFEVDVTSMEINDIVRSDEIALPAGVELVDKSVFNVVLCYGKRVALEEEEVEEGEEGAEGEEGETEDEDGGED